jgi:hypothetical protein
MMRQEYEMIARMLMQERQRAMQMAALHQGAIPPADYYAPVEPQAGYGAEQGVGRFAHPPMEAQGMLHEMDPRLQAPPRMLYEGRRR